MPNEGDYVIFKEIEGMVELNDGKQRKIKSIKSKDSFILDEDSSSFGKYIKKGICIEKKKFHIQILKKIYRMQKMTKIFNVKIN